MILRIAPVLALVTGCGTEVRILEDNDFFIRGRSTDRFYTQGARVEVTGPTDLLADSALTSALRTLRVFPPDDGSGEETQFVTGAIVQRMYTPQDLSLHPDDPLQRAELERDRPYAGWLFGAVALHHRVLDPDPDPEADRRDRLDSVELQIGVLGPSSHAEAVQTWWHEVIGSPDPKGWDAQIGSEVGVNLVWNRRFRVHYHELPLGAYDTVTTFGGSLGTVDTYGQLGTELRWGFELPRDFGHAAIAARDEDADGFSAFIYVSALGRYVVRDATLEGRLFYGDEHTVAKNDFVADLRVGATVRLKCLELGYAVVRTTPEFLRESDPQVYGALSVRWFVPF